MKTETFVKDSTDIIRVISLSEGDAYRRLVKKTSYSEDRQLAYGVVTGALSNGEETVITATEVTLDDGYSSTPTIKQVTFAGDQDLVIFAAPIEDIREFMHQANRAQIRKMDEAEKAAQKARDDKYQLEVVLDRIVEGAVRPAEHQVIVGKAGGRAIADAPQA